MIRAAAARRKPQRGLAGQHQETPPVAADIGCMALNGSRLVIIPDTA
ncbi:hypothetical protein [Thioalkalivibrio sp. AKL12]|nr:hypothetical protein [Thioalkalivibrio sp. AKL12]